MNKAIPCIAILATLALIPASSAAPAYNPFGVQNDVAVDKVLGGGWRILYQGLYRDGVPSISTLFRAACDKVMLASKRLGSTKFDVLAAVEASVFVPLITSRNTSILSNGAEWYKNNQSLGFAGSGDIINQTSADTNALGERDRLSWHTIQITGQSNIRLNPGWRSGNNVKLDKSNQWERFILTTVEASATSRSAGKPSCLPLG